VSSSSVASLLNCNSPRCGFFFHDFDAFRGVPLSSPLPCPILLSPLNGSCLKTFFDARLAFVAQTKESTIFSARPFFDIRRPHQNILRRLASFLRTISPFPHSAPRLFSQASRRIWCPLKTYQRTLRLAVFSLFVLKNRFAGFFPSLPASLSGKTKFSPSGVSSLSGSCSPPFHGRWFAFFSLFFQHWKPSPPDPCFRLSKSLRRVEKETNGSLFSHECRQFYGASLRLPELYVLDAPLSTLPPCLREKSVSFAGLLKPSQE